MAKLKKETIDALTRKPIYTKDKGKIKAYADSLSAYNKGEKIYNDFIKFSNENNLMIRKKNGSWTDTDGTVYENEFLPIESINKNISPKYLYTFLHKGNKYKRGEAIEFGGAVDKNNNEVSKELTNKLEKFLEKYPHYAAPRYKKPVQPYLLKEDEIIDKISPIGQKEIEIENEELSPVELKNKKINVKEPEHWLDVTEPNGKGTKRMYFESKEEKETFMKENPMLRIGQNTTAKIKPEILQMLKNKK